MIDPTGYDIRRRPDKTTMWLIIWVRSTLKSELNCHDRLDKIRSIMKAKQDNDMTDHKGMISIEYNTKLLSPTRQCAIYEEDGTGQWLDRLYKSVLCRKWNWTIMTDSMRYSLWWRLDRMMMWLIVQVQSTSKFELNCHDQSDRMQSIMKSK